jgi:O-antigen ligase
MINLIALITTFGRTGYFLFVTVSIIVLVLRLPIIARFLSLILILIMTPFIYLTLMELFTNDLSAIQRFDSLFFAVEMLQESPIFGHGLGSFERISLEHGKDYRDVFSLYFNILYSGGIIGLMLFILYIYAVLKKISLPISLSILTLFLVMPAYNLTFVWVLLAINSIDRNKFYVKSKESARVLN